MQHLQVAEAERPRQRQMVSAAFSSAHEHQKLTVELCKALLCSTVHA